MSLRVSLPMHGIFLEPLLEQLFHSVLSQGLFGTYMYLPRDCELPGHWIFPCKTLYFPQQLLPQLTSGFTVSTYLLKLQK